MVPPSKAAPVLDPSRERSAIVVGGTTEGREVLRWLLRKHHFWVKAALPGPSAMQGLNGDGSADVYFVETQQEEGTWEGAVRAIAHHEPRPRLVLLAPRRGPDVEARARALGVNAVIWTPFDPGELRAVLDGP